MFSRMPAPVATRFPLGAVTMLGLATIAAYGAWYYAFGVLLDPLLDETGWPEGAVSATFALSAAAGGLGALPAGRLLDRVGARPVLLLAAGISAVALFTASIAGSPLLFAVSGAVGGAALAALGFYHVTQTTAVRVAPDRAARAISLVTIYGAFSSTIYLPLAAFLVARTDWRATLRILAITTAIVLTVTALVVRERERPGHVARTGGVGLAFGRPEVRRYVVSTALVGVAVGVVLVYQVPIMTGAGLPITTAAWLAGARGAAQLLGRVPLPWVVARLGPRASLRLAFAAITAGILALSASGQVAFGVLYVVLAGFGVGATSPLQGIYADELFERPVLGTAMGGVTMVFGLAMGVGPLVVGVLSEAGAGRSAGVALAVASAGSATLLLRRPEPR
jgi:predicted MFS family arabinose efflux permease